MNGYTLRIHIRDDILKLYKAIVEATDRTRAAYQQAETQPKGGDHFSQENVSWLTSFERPEREGYAALGRFVYERMQELEAELSRWEEITAINCNPQVDEIKLEGMDAVYAYEDDHPFCQNCGERLNTEDGCHCDNPMGPDDGS